MQEKHPDIPFTGFEGPEKKLEVEFRVTDSQDESTLSWQEGLRSVSKEEWQLMLDEANCTIISELRSEHCTAYVLSESSLFVYPFKIMVKTCGTTTLLKVIPILLSLARRRGMEPEFLFFSRKNYVFPDRQKAPHTGFDDETKFLNHYFNGSAYVVGPRNHDHWYMYIADYRKKEDLNVSRPCRTSRCILEILMHDLDHEKMQQFYKNDQFVDVKTTTERSGIAGIQQGTDIDDFQFDPCGYSMNGLLDSSYSTIHITPEPHCSFVSYETNVELSNMADYQKIIQRVLDVFRPGRFTATLFADHDSPLEKVTYAAFPAKIGGIYQATNKAFYQCSNSTLNWCSYKLKQATSTNTTTY